VDADGAPDIVAINANGGHQVYLNDGNASFVLSGEQFASGDARGAATGRLGVDDRIDVVVTGPDATEVFYNDGRGNLGLGDTQGPTLRLVGAATIELDVGAEFTDPGATATDDIDGDVSDRIEVENGVDTALVGTHTVTYTATD